MRFEPRIRRPAAVVFIALAVITVLLEASLRDIDPSCRGGNDAVDVLLLVLPAVFAGLAAAAWPWQRRVVAVLVTLALGIVMFVVTFYVYVLQFVGAGCTD